MLEIIPMQPHHIPQVYKIEAEAFTTPWSIDSFRRELINPHTVYLVALLNQNVVGFGGMWHIINEGHITNIAIDKEFRRMNIGKQLMQELILIAKSRNMTGITLEVRVSNFAAIALYQKLGFREEGIRKGYYSDTKEDAIIMWIFFDEVVYERE